MKIVDRATFLAMPAGTVFAYYYGSTPDDVNIKGETWDNDFLVNVIGLPDMTPWGKGEFFINWTFYGRDGSFEEDQLFAIYDADEVKGLIALLNDALASGYGEAQDD